jgi:hypothetical protein
MTPGVKINGQHVPWSFIQTVRKACGDDWDRTIDAFWQARNATGDQGIVKYLAKGLRADPRGTAYALIASKDRDAGKMEEIRKWWQNSVHSPKKRPSKIGEILRSIAADQGETLRATSQSSNTRHPARARAGGTGAKARIAADAEPIALTL